MELTMSKPLLSIFADGLRYDSLQYMPFVSSLNSVPLKTILGYSITCHPTMYTGVNPNKHKIAFHWIKGRQSFGPYALFSFFPDLFPLGNPYVQAIFSHFYAKVFLKKKARPFMGYGKILNLSMRYWRYLDINECKYWDEDNYLNENIKTIFELVRKNNLKYHVSGLHKPMMGILDNIEVVSPKGYDWVYYFVGESDSLSHKYLQHSKKSKNFLRRLDIFIRDRYHEFVKEYGQNGFDMVFWSDHGHIPIIKHHNLYEMFEKNKFKLKKIFHIIDSTTVRFWTNDHKEKERIMEIMGKIPEARFVADDEYSKLNLSGDNHLYGDLFYYLKGGSIFTHTIHGFGLETLSMHGYHPDEVGNQGVFVANRRIKFPEAALADVFTTSISSLGINYSPKVALDGKNILS